MPHRLTFAPADSIDRFAGWTRDLGELTGTARADDFVDVAPDAWRPTGRPLVRLRFQEASDLVHYNRIEGAYTGLGVEAKLRDAAPGIVVRGNLGWAWAERTTRGRASVERQTGRLWPIARVSRSLDLTNDFREPFDSGSTLGALFSIDDYDYVDRHLAVAGFTWFLTRRRDARVRLEAGVGSDRYAFVHKTRGPLAPGDSGFRFNRGVDAGRYRTATIKIEVHPEVNGAFVRPGIGVVLQGQAASGDLAWQRAELRLVGRRAFGPCSVRSAAGRGRPHGRLDSAAATVRARRKPESAGIRLQGICGQPGSGASRAGDVSVPTLAGAATPGRWVLPGVAPTISFGAQSGWADATNDAARSAIARLGTVGDSRAGIPDRRSGRAGVAAYRRHQDSVDFDCVFSVAPSASGSPARPIDMNRGNSSWASGRSSDVPDMLTAQNSPMKPISGSRRWPNFCSTHRCACAMSARTSARGGASRGSR